MMMMMMMMMTVKFVSLTMHLSISLCTLSFISKFSFFQTLHQICRDITTSSPNIHQISLYEYQFVLLKTKLIQHLISFPLSLSLSLSQWKDELLSVCEKRATRRAQMSTKPNHTELRRTKPTKESHHPRGFILESAPEYQDL